MDSLLRKIINKQKIPLEHFESFKSRQKIVNIKRLITKKLTAIRKSADSRLIVEISGSNYCAVAMGFVEKANQKQEHTLPAD